MRHLLRSANQFDEAMKELASIPNARQAQQGEDQQQQQLSWTRNNNPPIVGQNNNSQNDLFSRSSQLITNMNAITKSNSGGSSGSSSNSWWKVAEQSSPTPTNRRYSSSVDGDKEGGDYLRSFEVASNQRRLSQQESNLKHVNHLQILLEETRRLSDQVDGQLTSMLSTPTVSTTTTTPPVNGTSASNAEEGLNLLLARKPIAAPRIKKLGSSSVMSQLTQLRRMYEAADEPESDTSTKADQEVCSYLGDRDGELFSGSWSKVKAKRNSAILSDVLKSSSSSISHDHDLYLGILIDGSREEERGRESV